MAYEHVMIGSEPYTVFADVATADLYLDAAFQADSWRLGTTTQDMKARLLVTSTRILDRQLWKGDKFDEAQEHAFPRKNMGITGLDDSVGVTPNGIVAGSIELALALLDGSDVQDQRSNAERIRSMTAGSVSITNFRGIDSFLGTGGGTRFPLIVQELIGTYLLGSGFGVAKAVGTDKESVFPGDYGFGRGV